MNMHMPQSVQTMVELQEITIVPKHILSPAKSSPLISLTQDSLVAGYLFTNKGTLLAEDKIYDILAFNDHFDQEKLGEPDEIRDGMKYYSSNKVFSQVLPPLSYDGAGGVVIRNGIMEKGQLTIRVLGGSNDSLVHNIYNMYGSKKCQEFLDDSQTLLTKWLTEHAFSIGLGDMIPPPAVRIANEFIIEKYIEKTRELVESARQGTYQTDLPARYRREKFEDEMQGITTRLSNEIKDMQKKYINPNDNQLSTAVESGSKGKYMNIIQILGCIGQQALWGKRIPESFTNRTLPHYHKHDVGAAAGGFVRNSFIDGGTPAEFYWQAMGGRVSMIDTAIKSVTPETPIIVLENGETKYVTIGEWIDKRLEESSSEVEHHVEREMELLKLKDEVAIPTTDEKGNVTWGTVTAITRHDPGKELYKIETQSGRDVIVTESKALLIWDHEKEEFHMKDTPLVRTGDFVPVTAELAEPPTLDNSFLGKSTDEVKEFLEEYFETDEFNGGDKLKCGETKTDAVKFAMLFSRLGIFVEIFNDGTIIIPKHGTYQTSSNVVLDKIIAITLIDVKDYPKVYDLTIPSTLNFGLANGLQVVDTAESGYIQRRLIKAMEDNKVCYDGTVRNAANKIIQFTYGDDGFDTMRLEKQKLELMKDSDLDMIERYKFDLENEKEMRVYMTDDTVARLKKTQGYEKKLEEEFNRLKTYRDELRTKYMEDLDVMDTTLWSPVNYWRLIPATIYQFRGESSERSDLTPVEVIEKVDELIEEILSYYTEKEYAMKLFIILTRTMMSSKVLLYDRKINSLILDSLIDKIKSKILQSFARPGEMVGPLAAQSIGEPSTQLTLNSVDWEEPIIIMRNGMTEDVRFGEFVDYMIENGKGRADHLEHEQIYKDTSEDDLKVMAVDPEGIVRWRKINAVTRHLPVNKDGTDTILEVTTASGRTVKATKAKSFLMRVDNKIVPVNGSDLKIGDRLPVSFVFPMNDIEELNEISVEQWFPKNEYIWGSEMKKAYDFSKTKRRWFKEHNGKDFTVPYKRSDTCLVGLKAEVQVYEEGFVYNRCCTGPHNSYGIPDTFKLDNLFGFFIGAYLAEGLVTKTYIAIANNDYGFLFRLIQFCEKYNLGFHLTRRYPKGKDGKEIGLSTDIRIHSTMLASFLLKTCGNGSEFKFVPNFAYIANKDFIKGILDGYISGDGCVNLDRTIICSSVSEALIDGMINLLARFNIFSRKKKPKKQKTNNRGSLDIKQHYVFKISTGCAFKFAENISLIIPEKQDRLDKIISDNVYMYKIGRDDIIPSVKIGEIEGDIHRDELKKIVEFVEDEEEKDEIIKAISQNVYYDPIVSIKEVSPTHRHVYDFTVEKDFTFLTRNMGIFMDTFHLSGVAGKSAVTSTGVPRLREIINLAKTIDKPNMTVSLKEEYRYDREKAEELRESLEYTKIEDIIQETMIMYENDTLDVTHDEDQEFIRVYHEFSEILGIDDLDEYSRWTLRLVFDKEKMLNKNIYMQDVQDSILNTCDNQGLIKTVFSDDNSGNLVLRLSVKHDSDSEGEYMELLKSLEECILNITLRGLSGIEQVTMAQDNRVVYNEDGSYETKKIWEIYTAGTNLNSILAYDMVDAYKTISNDFYEIEEIFGIEGVRTVLMRELSEMLGDKSEYSVNYRHIKLLVDTMTYRGVMMAIGRHGINRNKDNSVLTKASFEETTEIFINAGTFGEKDDMQGISGNVIMGQFANMGTNMFDMYLDEDMVGEHFQGEEEVDEDEEYDPYELESEIDNMDTDNVTDDDFNFGFTIDPNNQYTLPNVEIGGNEMQLDIDGKVEKIKLDVIEEEPEITSDEESEPEISSDEEEEEGGEPDVDSDREEKEEHEKAIVIEEEEEEEESEPEISSEEDSEEEENDSEFNFTENVD